MTAGPTREDIDPVRFLTNRSSGKMGYAIADAAARRGARVVLVSGPTQLDAPSGVERIDVRSAEQMHRAVIRNARDASVIVMAAAVADYRPVAPAAKKIKRQPGNLTLELESTPDILADVARDKGDRILVGFAAETENVAEHARGKLQAKQADLIVANDVTAEGAGFDHDTNVVSFYSHDSEAISLPRMKKLEVAGRILDFVLELRRDRSRRTLSVNRKATPAAHGAP